MLRNNICHPILFLCSFILFILSNIFSADLISTMMLTIIVLIFLLKTNISFHTYFYLLFPLLCFFVFFLFYPNIMIKITNIIFYFLFFIYNQSDLSLFYICYKIPFLNEKQKISVTNKLCILSKVSNYTDIIIETFKKRTHKRFLNPILFYKFLKNKIENEKINNLIMRREKEIYLQKIKQGNLYELRLLDIIFLLFHGIIVLMMMGGIL